MFLANKTKQLRNTKYDVARCFAMSDKYILAHDIVENWLRQRTIERCLKKPVAKTMQRVFTSKLLLLKRVDT